jgi:hypothetical protein
MYQLQESERVLFVSALDCIRRTYRHRPTGVALAGLIPTIGSILLPLLDNTSSLEMNDRVAETIMGLIGIDGDALYRPLVELVGGILKPYSWNNDLGGDPTSAQVEQGVLSKVSMLLQAIECQAEQDIW